MHSECADKCYVWRSLKVALYKAKHQCTYPFMLCLSVIGATERYSEYAGSWPKNNPLKKTFRSYEAWCQIISSCRSSALLQIFPCSGRRGREKNNYPTGIDKIHGYFCLAETFPNLSKSLQIIKSGKLLYLNWKACLAQWCTCSLSPCRDIKKQGQGQSKWWISPIDVSLFIKRFFTGLNTTTWKTSVLFSLISTFWRAGTWERKWYICDTHVYHIQLSFHPFRLISKALVAAQASLASSNSAGGVLYRVH